MLNLIYFFVAKFLQKLMWNQAQLKKKHFYLRHLRISSRKKKQKNLTDSFLCTTFQRKQHNIKKISN